MMSMAAMAQKGSWYVGGTVGFNSTTDKAAAPSTNKDVTTSWSFAPEAGTFLKDDIQLGFALGLSGSTDKVNGTKTTSTFGFSPMVYSRKFFKITDNFSAFAGVYLKLISDKTTTYTGATSVENKTSGIDLHLGAGVAYALSPRFTAVGQYGLLGYQSTTDKTGGVSNGTSSSFYFGANTIGPVLNVGLYYTLKKAE